MKQEGEHPKAVAYPYMDMTMPGVQYPHWVPLKLAIRFWMGWYPSFSLPSPSIVVICHPSALISGHKHWNADTWDFLRRDQLLCWLPCLMTFSLYFCVEFPYQDTWDFLRKDQLLWGPSCLISFSSYIYVVSLPRYMGFPKERPTSLWTTLSGNIFSSYFYVEIPYQDTWDFLRKDQLLCGPRCLMTFSSYCRGVGMGCRGKQAGSMSEEPQVRGCYNITFICTPTNQETVCWKRHKQTKHLEHESKCKV